MRGRLALVLCLLAGAAVLAVAWIDAGREPVTDQVLPLVTPKAVR